MKIAIAQCAPALGAPKRNLAMHADWIGRARDAGASLVVFPELSLTGYYLKDLAADVACAADDPFLAPIGNEAVEDGWISVVRDVELCGFVVFEKALNKTAFASAGYNDPALAREDLTFLKKRVSQ